MNPTLFLRRASRDDEDFLWRVYASTRWDEFAQLGWPVQQQESFLRMQYRTRCLSYSASYPGAEESIVLEDVTPVGAMTVSRTSAEVRLVDIAFLPEFRGRGFGTEVISGLIQQAAASSIPLRLSVLRQNRAHRLYQRHPFVSKSEDAMYIEMEIGGSG